MTVTAQSQYLRIFDETKDYERWQNYYVNKTVEWLDNPWIFQPFESDGLIAGDIAAEGSLTIRLPITDSVSTSLRNALRFGRIVEVLQYEFDPTIDNDTPQGLQKLVAQHIGQVIGINGSFTSLELELGSTLAPVGIQVPPRTFTSQLIGVPVQL